MATAVESTKEYKRLRAQISQFKGHITRVANFVEEQKTQILLDIEGLKLRGEQLEEALKKYKQDKLEILLLQGDPTDETLVEDEVEERCLLVLTDIRRLERNKDKVEVTGNRDSTSSIPHNRNKLPQLNIPFFNGKNIVDYKPFMDIFVAIIDRDSELSSVQKLFYLRTYLKDEALALIEGLPLSNESYLPALALIDKRYNNKCILIIHHVNLLLDFPAISRGTAQSLRQLISYARQQVGALKTLGQSVQHWDMILIPILLRKLDAYSCRAYHSDRDQSCLPTLEDFFDYIDKRATSFEESQRSEVAGKSIAYIKSKVTNFSNSSKILCKFCQSTDHKLFSCKKFSLLSSNEKLDFVDKLKLCKVCLNSHNNRCKFHFKCSLCKSKEHNSLLHSEQLDNNLTSLQNNVNNGMVLLPTIKVKIQTQNGSYIIVKALLDSGSQTSFIAFDLIKKLGLVTYGHHITISALGQEEKSLKRAINLTLYSLHNNYNCNVRFSVVDKITSILPQTKINLSNINIPDNIQLADDDFNIPSQIPLLLSADIFFNIMLPNKIDLQKDHLTLLATKFGYIVSGNLHRDFVTLCNENKNSIVLQVNNNMTNVDHLIQTFWEQEHIPEMKQEVIANDTLCETEFIKSVQLTNGRFQVKIPLKYPIEDLQLGDSFSLALQRLNSTVKRLSKNFNLKEDYCNFIKEYINLGHAKVIDLSTFIIPIEKCYFLSHHPVIKQESKTTKLRVVFDGSAKTNLKTCLNDVMYNGPVVQNDLFNILILFRTYKYVILCDIKQCYRQILIDPSQRHLLNILWKENLNDPLTCLQLQTVTYGLRSSSFLSTRCLIELANRYENQFPSAASVLRNNVYVDDCLFGENSIEKLLQVRSELINLLKIGSFELHKWCANHPSLLTNIPENKLYLDNKQIGQSDYILKVLGVSLDIKNDNFLISKPKGKVPFEWTKRTVLSFIGTFFDPLGFAGPIITRAKEFMQKIWLSKIGWDIPLPIELVQQWNSFYLALSNMPSMKIERNLKLNDAIYIDLIGYCDASNIAYGACLYIRIVCNDNVSVKLLCSKSRIAPCKNKLTIPQLELCSAVLLSKLYNKVKNILYFVNFHRKILFSDSVIVLCWLESKKLPPNVAKKVNEIASLTQNCEWYHVNGIENPADCLSRGINPSDLLNHRLWWHGHPALHDKNYCPNNHVLNDIDNLSNLPLLKEDTENVHCNTIKSVLPFNKFSSIIKIQRVFAYVLRFINNCRTNKLQREVNNLTVSEINYSMTAIIKYVQSIHFSDDIKCFKNNRPIKSNLKKLHPFMDDSGVLRVSGRLENANIPYSQKCPIILPKQCHITTLIVRNEHKALMHAGLKLTLSSLVQKYYIVCAIKEIKKIIHRCTICFRFKAENAKQLMAALPHDRVIQDKVFNKIGIDSCGPFNIKQSTIRRSIISKGYVCIFICFVTKCIHMELVSDLTTECFLAAFKRFCGRRGMPKIVYCDNASTFKGANNQLKQLFDLNCSKQHKDSVIDYCACKGIEFNFIPSYSPTFGGLWESAVKSAKYHFRRIIGNNLFTYETFNTILVQVEGMLNSRPLTQLTYDTDDFSFLSPSHFLVGKPINAPPEIDLSKKNINVLRIWDRCKMIQQHFWQVWHKNYLSQLISRPKWHMLNSNVAVGALVLLLGENVPPLQWPLARITKIFKGSDGNIRVVEVRTPTGGSHKRAINKIALLPIYQTY